MRTKRSTYLAAVSYYFILPVNHFLFIFIFQFESRWWRGFPHFGPLSLLYYRYRGKAVGTWVDLPPLSNAKVKKWVELFFYSPSGPSWPVLGWTWPFYLHRTRSGVDGMAFRLWARRSGVWIQVGEGRFSLLQIRPYPASYWMGCRVISWG